MASIILSFVGKQDPASESTNEEGSIVTLIRHLLKSDCSIKKVLLLYSEDTKGNALLTQEWLQQEDFQLTIDQVELMAVSPSLSEDPVDVRLATQEANKGLKQVWGLKENNDIFEFNSSSGTPSMKTAWGILQASGYGKNTRLWQVRNPKTMKESQLLVFENNVNVFKNESDFSVIKKQLQNYNYGGALQTLKNSDFDSHVAQALLEYGYYRLAFDFKLARTVIQPYQQQVKPELLQNINELYNEHILELLQEAYYKSIIKLKTKQYADFLILLFSFQENVLKFLVKQQLLQANFKTLDWQRTENQIRSKIEQRELNKYLKAYRYNGQSLKLDEKINRIVMLAILEHFSDLSSVILLLKELENSCQDRNDLVHNLKGISELENEKEIIKTMRQIMEFVKPDFETTNPFNSLNEQILDQLTPIVRG
ncbi:hypothetical protein [Crocosphaera sp. XPORK-15E]|uniref:hypothetical protein n=1 Tax=Crocosphaera sp. XPORK-15E TaxID=3110247 RepID=UPI002B2175E2|nr:hypothetical protein [Crocosphaera sp. XPORK-15E]MEA5537028.1 hypothetical protein [Crocosphaera sp. XPORK-15E]